MRQCPACGGPVLRQYRFCLLCGEELPAACFRRPVTATVLRPRRCQRCGGELAQDHQFCPICGHTLHEQNVPLQTVARSLPKASTMRRVVASLIDRCLPCPFLVLVYPPWVLVVVAYHLFVEGLWQGRSPGKRLLGLRTISLEHIEPCTLLRAMLRNMLTTARQLAYLSLVFFPLALLVDVVELLVVLGRRDGRRLGDFLAGTIVVREQTFTGVQGEWQCAPKPSMSSN
jgi:uncharacterized RDD family membrane protein YckC